MSLISPIPVLRRDGENLIEFWVRISRDICPEGESGAATTLRQLFLTRLGVLSKPHALYLPVHLHGPHSRKNPVTGKPVTTELEWDSVQMLTVSSA